jgi:hypothetical protein
MTDSTLWQLIILKFTGEATPEQLAELEQNPSISMIISTGICKDLATICRMMP